MGIDANNTLLTTTPDDPREEHEGLRILARMIAHAIIRDTKRQKNPSAIPSSTKMQ
jgi:hypothetical protein